MNHLNDLVDSLKKRRFIENKNFETPDDWARLTISVASQAMCFIHEDAEVMDGMAIIPELIRLPYQDCWIEATHRGFVTGLLCSETDRGIVGVVFIKDVEWIVAGPVLFERFSDGVTAKALCEIDLSSLKSLAQEHAGFVAAFLSALNCVNVTRTEHQASERLQKARVRRGKQPLFSYWTLDLDVKRSREVGADLGGTHASPRLHLRRGHPRQYAPGKFCWVQPCAVGSKAAGFVHKDYCVRTGENVHQQMLMRANCA